MSQLLLIIFIVFVLHLIPTGLVNFEIIALGPLNPILWILRCHHLVVELFIQLVIILKLLGPCTVEMGSLILWLQRLPIKIVSGIHILLSRCLPVQCPLVDIT
jgi:hypothetical protein